MPSQEENTLQIFTQLTKNHIKKDIIKWEPLPQSGSHRHYYRLTLNDGNTIIGAYNDDVAENIAFFSYTRFFTEKKINVPTLLAVADDNKHYLQNDLGNSTLYDYLSKNRNAQGEPSPEVVAYYEQVVRLLPTIQLSGKQGVDFSVAYPRAAFDRQSMQWDLNYFKYYFLKLANIPFNEQLLEDDFNNLIKYLLSADSDFFLYRDFQSRNIMVNQNNIYFIDYQGGRKGALQYDIASLLYDGKADLSPMLRDHLLTLYINTLNEHIEVNRKVFLSYFQGFVLIRILQAMGAYGYRGYFERKSHFLQSVPYALHNIENLLNHFNLPIKLPELTRVLRSLINSNLFTPYQPAKTLTIQVQSFSYKQSIPQDPSPNGGGFVFDCRALPNPGREPKYRTFTGKDHCVIDFFNQHSSICEFKNHVFALIEMSIENYLERHFDHLMINFGCTGGQHRSVYFAEQTAQHIRNKYPNVKVELKHTAQV